MHRFFLLLLASLGFVAQGAAAATPQTLAEALAAHRYTLHLEDGQLAGDGAAFLAAAARPARYVLVGEDHGISEMMTLTTALFRTLQPLGFETYVTEVGPGSAEQLQQLAADPRGATAFADFFAHYPFTIPFAVYEEEVALLRTVAAASAVEAPIWGIDQEFIFAPRLLLDTLAQRATGAVRTDLEALVAREAEAYETVVASGRPDTTPMFMSQPLPTRWATIRQHFTAQGDDAARDHLDALAASHEVYGHFFAGSYHDNNHSRARLMKRNLAAHFARHGDDRRLLIKLGANHVMRGHSSFGVQDIGNTFSELAAVAGEESLHLLVVPRAGTQNAWLPFMPPQARSVPVNTNAPGYAPIQPLLSALPPTEGWSVYDLRPLRPAVRRWAKEAPELASTILGYDVVVFLDTCRAARLVPTLDPDDAP